MKIKLTLIELIIAILVLGLLTALAMPQFIGVKANADVASFKNDIDVLHKAVDEMYVREDKLPLGDSVDKSTLDVKLLDAIYASGDSGNHLFKIELDQSKKYHNALKTPVDEENFFIYSKETGKIFYTKGMIDGDNKTLYTMEYIGLSSLKIGANALINGAKVPVDSPLQTIEGQVPVNSDVSVSINGTSIPVTYEDVAFEGMNNILAASKTKKFTSEVLLTQNKNVLTLKTGSTVTNFTIYLGENEGGGSTPEVPVIKPVAVISMTPEQAITTSTNITWGYENSTAAEGRTITNAEWEGKQDIYSTEGVYTVRLRVQDSTGVWSDWAEKIINVSKISYNTFNETNYTLSDYSSVDEFGVFRVPKESSYIKFGDSISQGVYYMEFEVLNNQHMLLGVFPSEIPLKNSAPWQTDGANVLYSNGYLYTTTGSSTSSKNAGIPFISGTVVGIKLDMDNKELTYYVGDKTYKTLLAKDNYFFAATSASSAGSQLSFKINVNKDSIIYNVSET